MRKNTCAIRSRMSISGLPEPPSAVSATPNNTAKKTICRISPFANASTTLDGTIFVRKSTNFIPSPALAYCEMSPLASADTSTPSPGRVRFTITRPIASANVLTISKYRNALPPTFPTFFRSTMFAIPSTMVRKMIGPMTILTSFTKVSPRGRSDLPRSGASAPSRAPSAIAVSTCTVRFEAKRFMQGRNGEASGGRCERDRRESREDRYRS